MFWQQWPRNRKLMVMFAPLVVLIAGLFVMILDLKSPLQVTTEKCLIMGTGESVSVFRREDNMLYRQGNLPVNDIAFRCPGFGVVMVNDHEPMNRTIVVGTPTTITRKHYRWMPDKWTVTIDSPIFDAE